VKEEEFAKLPVGALLVGTISECPGCSDYFVRTPVGMIVAGGYLNGRWLKVGEDQFPDEDVSDYLEECESFYRIA
jgi:hypothetical protein